jgi:hypothetical protein
MIESVLIRATVADFEGFHMWRGDPDDCGNDRRAGRDHSFFITLLLIWAQDVFIIPDGGPGALAELERRKFTAEEGVS